MNHNVILTCAVTGAGEPFLWDATYPIIYAPDRGPLGQLTNEEARTLLREAFERNDREIVRASLAAP